MADGTDEEVHLLGVKPPREWSGSATPYGGRPGPPPRPFRRISHTCTVRALPVRRCRWASMIKAARCCPSFLATKAQRLRRGCWLARSTHAMVSTG